MRQRQFANAKMQAAVKTHGPHYSVVCYLVPLGASTRLPPQTASPAYPLPSWRLIRGSQQIHWRPRHVSWDYLTPCISLLLRLSPFAHLDCCFCPQCLYLLRAVAALALVPLSRTIQPIARCRVALMSLASRQTAPGTTLTVTVFQQTRRSCPHSRSHLNTFSFCHSLSLFAFLH
jgi:hypothetical protein